MPQANINLWAVFISSVISMIIGFLWYGPLFGKAWIKLMKIASKQIQDAKKKGMGKSYFIAFIGSLVMSYVLAHFVDYTQSTTFGQGMQTGFWIWIGFVATRSLGMMLWENKPFKLYLLTIFYDLVNLIIMGGILAIWQ